MMRSVLLVLLLTSISYGKAQSGSAFLFQCSTAEEVREKHILLAVTGIDPKAMVSFNGAVVKMRFTQPQEEATMNDLLWRTGLSECPSRSILLIEEGSGMAPTTTGTIDAGNGLRHTTITAR
jgi:hypothetical protein